MTETNDPAAYKPTIILGADHGGFTLKEKAKTWLENWGYNYEDVGALTLDPEDDYTRYAFAVAEKVAAAGSEFQAGGMQPPPAIGLLFCRSGGGMAIAANKIMGIRAVELPTTEAARHARTDNDANVGSLAGDWLSDNQAETIIKTFLTTPFSGAERHGRRLAQIRDYEQHRRSEIA